MWPTILTLLLLGALLLVVEVFVPGLIVGSMGCLALLGATILTYTHYGLTAGNLLLVAELFGGVIFTLWWLRYMPRSSFARRWTLESTVGSTLKDDGTELLGQEGEAVSSLRPAGIAEIGGQRLGVVTEGELVSKGDRIRVVRIEGSLVVVRRKEVQTEVSA